MEFYEVKLSGSITERVKANNGEEARQLAIRLLNVRLGSGLDAGFIFDVERITTEEIK